jgi:thiosulfate reductase cytochrome b subunit
MSTQERYPLWLRLWHWLHGLVFLAEAMTGLALHYADISSPLIPFRYAVASHNILGVALVGLWLVFIVGAAVTGHHGHYWPKLIGLYTGAKKLGTYYRSGIMKGESSPFAGSPSRFNPVQRLTYFAVMYAGMPIIGFSGVLLLFPEWAPEKVLGAGGVWPMAILHLVAGYLLTLFVVVHVYLGTTGRSPTALYRDMWRGYEEEESDGS